MIQRRSTVSLLPVAVLLLLVTACGPQGEEESLSPAVGEREERLLVYTVSYPLAYFVQRIGGDRVRVEFPAPPGVDPAFWSPDAETVTAYQSADLILLNGAGYARWVDKVTLPASKLVDTSAGFRDRYLVVDDAAVHSHGPGGEHSHGETAFTIWLDPTLALEQGRAIQAALAAAWPDDSEVFDEGLAGLEEDLLALDSRLETIVSRQPGLALVGSHPVYQYLAGRYGLSLRSVHFEPDEYPDAAGWSSLETLLAAHPAGWMLWEGTPLEETVLRLRELGLESLVYDPCGNRPTEGDLLTVMEANLRGLERVFAP